VLDSIFARKIYALQAFFNAFRFKSSTENEHILLILNNIFTLAAIELFTDNRFDEKCTNQV